MKNHLLKALAVLAITGATSQTQAWSYTFSNHTDKEIGVAMRYYGFGEPRYFRWIPSHQGRQFTPKQATRSGLDSEQPIEARKIGFVARTWWYVANPSQANKVDRETAKTLPWREFEITWVPTEAYKIAIDLCEAVSAATIEGAKLALEAAMAAATDGASVAVQGAAKTAADAIDTLKAASAPASTPKTETAASTGTNKQAVLKAVQDGIVSDALTKLISAVGKAAGRSMMTDRHIDIIEDKKGIKFISLM